MTILAPIATGYMAPIHGRGAMGFLLLGILSLLVTLAGALSVSLALLLIGGAGVIAAPAGFALYARVMATKPLLVVFEDRLEFVRGPQKGTLAFADVSGARVLEWGRSFFPYSRAQRVLVLYAQAVEWQVGTEIADYAAVQEAVVQAIERFQAR